MLGDKGRDTGPQHIRSMAGIGIGEKDQLTDGGLVQLMAGPVLAQPILRQGRSLDHTQPIIVLGQPLQDPAGIVGGVVVQDNNLKIRIILSQ